MRNIAKEEKHTKSLLEKEVSKHLGTSIYFESLPRYQSEYNQHIRKKKKYSLPGEDEKTQLVLLLIRYFYTTHSISRPLKDQPNFVPSTITQVPLCNATESRTQR